MKTILTSAAFVAVLGLSGIVHSGEKTTANVVVSTAGRVAYGSMGSARNSTDTYQKLYCWVWSFDDGSGPFQSGGCYARDHNLSVSAQCGTVSPTLIAAIQALPSDTYLSFSWDTSGQCTNIKGHKGSQYAPKAL